MSLARTAASPLSRSLPLLAHPAIFAAETKTIEVFVRHWKLWISLLCLAGLSACGNGNDGRKLNPKGLKASSSTQSASPTGQLTSFGYCKPMSILGGSNPSFAQSFTGASVCTITGGAPMVRLKVSASFPLNSRFCLMPWNGNLPYPESCFTVNGDTDVALDLNATAYNSIVLVAESDLNAYKDYISFRSNIDPPRALAQMQL